jgi:hypothetical protein
MPPRRTSPRRGVTRPTLVRPGDEDEPEGGSTLLAAGPWIALLALAAAIVAVVVVLLNRGTDLSACRSAAWGAIPATADLPGGWTLGSTDLNANGMTVSIVGPASADGTAAQPAVYASVTCYGDSAATAMRQNKAASKSARSSVVDRIAGGDAYDVTNPGTGTTTTLFRVGDLIGQIAGAGSASPDDLATITRAVATAMGDRDAAGGPGPKPSAETGSEEPGASNLANGSEEPLPSAIAPELEADLPTTIQDVPLSVDSTTGDQALSSDPVSRAFAARLQSLGVKLSDVQAARALDPNGTIDIQVAGFRVPGLDSAKLKAAVLEAWLGANEAGVKVSTVKLGGKTLTKVDYGQDGPLDYVYATPDHVIVIDTADPDAAAEAASQLR